MPPFNKPDQTPLIKQINDLNATERISFLEQLPQHLTPGDRGSLTVSALDATQDSTKLELLTHSVQNLSNTDKETIRVALGAPSDPVRDRIWITVVTAFVFLIVGSFLALTVSLFLPNEVKNDARVQIILTVFSTASAFLTGLLAPSPIKNS
jgi:hypothetical protein